MNEAQLLKAVIRITKDKSLQQDGYDMNDRPLYISTIDEFVEYTVDKKGNVYQHTEDGETIKMGNINSSNRLTEEEI